MYIAGYFAKFSYKKQRISLQNLVKRKVKANMCKHPEGIQSVKLVRGMTFSFQATCALFHLPLDCFLLCGLNVEMHMVHLSMSSCILIVIPPMAIFVF